MNTQTVINTQTVVNTQTAVKPNSNSKINTKVQVQSSVVLLTHPDVIPIINESSGAKLLSITNLDDKKFWTGGGQVAKRTNFEYLILVFSAAVDIEKFSKAILDTKLLYSVINISKPWPKKIDKTTTVDESKAISTTSIKTIKKRSITPRMRKTVAPNVAPPNVAPPAPNVAPPNVAPANVAPANVAPANVAPANVAPPAPPAQPTPNVIVPPVHRNVAPIVNNMTVNANSIKIPVSNGENIINIPRQRK
jgi:hypothetical protein